MDVVQVVTQSFRAELHRCARALELFTDPFKTGDDVRKQATGIACDRVVESRDRPSKVVDGLHNLAG